MAQKECTATIDVVGSLLGMLSLEGYIWTTREDVQRHLDKRSVIIIGDDSQAEYTYSERDARRMENGVVYELVTYLSAVYEIDTDSYASVLAEDTAMITAARIGMAVMAAAIGNEITEWTDRLKNEAWSSLRRIFVNQTLKGTGITKKSVPYWKRLQMSQTRERAVVPNV